MAIKKFAEVASELVEAEKKPRQPQPETGEDPLCDSEEESAETPNTGDEQ